MTIAGVRKGDIIRAAGSHALVIDCERGRLNVQWIGTNNTRWVKAREVEAHWRRSKR